MYVYERTVIVNGKLSRWNAARVLIPKPNEIQPRLTFSHHFVIKTYPAVFQWGVDARLDPPVSPEGRRAGTTSKEQGVHHFCTRYIHTYNETAGG